MIRFQLGLRSACLVLSALVLTPAAWAATRRVELDATSVATLADGREIFLEALPGKGEGLLSFSRRYCGSSELASTVSEANQGSTLLLAGVRYRVPFGALLPEYQQRVLRAIFGRDEMVAAGWKHHVAPADQGQESLWHIAEWFTGRGENYREIRSHNRLTDDELEPDKTLVVPARLLRPSLRALLPPSSPYYLEYSRDGKGEYAVYRLKGGEALYSSVVVRFTGRVFGDDVNALATEIAERSGIRDVKSIAVGYAVKIPFDLLLPEFLPAGDERRLEYEKGLIASSQFSNQVRSRSLEGITVVLDAGHGGSDVGASVAGVWESVYVYDIMMRVRHLLRSTTAARVDALTRDGSEFRVAEADVLPFSRGHRVLTTPNYTIEDSTVALHLRWYLANSHLRRAEKAGRDRDKVVFVSIHADSLHSSLRGAMAYIPGASYTGGSYGKTGSVYAARSEVREQPKVSFSSHDRVRSEGLSRDLARDLMDAFERAGLAVHADKPIREKVIRKRRAWVPAVLRYNEIPAKMLLEVCNLANAEDRKLLQTGSFRQRVAEAVVDGIHAYYGDTREPSDVRVAASGR